MRGNLNRLSLICKNNGKQGLHSGKNDINGKLVTKQLSKRGEKYSDGYHVSKRYNGLHERMHFIYFLA